MKTTVAKAHGIHYTPPALAEFLAHVTAERLTKQDGKLTILDPACGSGALLVAFAQAMPDRVRRNLTLVGFETDSAAIAEAETRLLRLDVGRVSLRQADFLAAVGPTKRQRSFLEPDGREPLPAFDAVIANPPYVRTQVLGSAKSQELANRFGLSGRVDLYHAFTKAMAAVLKPGGILGLLTSNRFLTIRSGAAMRQYLSSQFELHAIYDLGDTKLFSAAVLPVIVVAGKTAPSNGSSCAFTRVYEHRQEAADDTVQSAASILQVLLERRKSDLVRTETGLFRVERGVLLHGGKGDVWTLSTPRSRRWLHVVARHRVATFDDVARVRVGIKTTADEVFIRDDWNTLPANERPEAALLRPLIRHYNAERWIWSGKHRQAVLYPHVAPAGSRRAINLRDYPRARRYLESHRERLTSRHYVVESGRKWYEIWVPHHPDDWATPKIVFPDIAEHAKFFLDRTGAVVNGDCYWMTLRSGVDPDWLLLTLAVANSSFISQYYDTAFHNKLYSGRRRFMTQYVRQFPLPSVTSETAHEIIRLTSQLVESPLVDPVVEAQIDRLVWEAFGLGKEVVGKMDL